MFKHDRGMPQDRNLNANDPSTSCSGGYPAVSVYTPYSKLAPFFRRRNFVRQFKLHGHNKFRCRICRPPFWCHTVRAKGRRLPCFFHFMQQEISEYVLEATVMLLQLRFLKANISAGLKNDFVLPNRPPRANERGTYNRDLLGHSKVNIHRSHPEWFQSAGGFKQHTRKGDAFIVLVSHNTSLPVLVSPLRCAVNTWEVYWQ